MVLLGTFTSVRLGEALDLQRRDLDLHQGVLQVDLQLQELKSGKRIVREPKGGGEREISIPPHLNDDITQHLEQWVGPGKSAYVFTGERGGPVRRNFFNADWRKRVDALDLGLGNFHFHDLRHTGNTAAIVPTASNPPASNLRRHRRTVSDVVEHARAIASFATPSAASNKPDACTTVRCGSDVEHAIDSNTSRCSPDTLNETAVITGMPQP